MTASVLHVYVTNIDISKNPQRITGTPVLLHHGETIDLLDYMTIYDAADLYGLADMLAAKVVSVVLILSDGTSTSVDQYDVYTNILETLLGSTSGAPGPQGIPGSQIYVGGGAPGSGLGVSGDFYLDSISGYYYKKTNAWGSPLGSLIGPQGPQGPQGNPGTTFNLRRLSFVLSAQDIANQYISLPDLATTDSLQVSIDRLNLHQDEDFSVGEVNGVTRIYFINSVGSSGVEHLSEGQMLFVRYIVS
jgi:hypothetical protein